MSRSRSRLAADWFAKLRMNAATQEVEHIEVVEASETATAIDLTPKADVTYVDTEVDALNTTVTRLAADKADTTYVDTEITAVEATVTSLSTSKADVTAMNTALATKADTTYVDGVTSSIQTQLNAKEPADATILKDADIGSTVLAPNGDGSQLTGIDALPDQTGHSGKYLNTDGTGASWQSISSDPTMGGDLSGTASNAQIVANAVGSSEIATNAVSASELNVSGNGTSGQMLTSDGDGSMSWANQPSSGLTVLLNRTSSGSGSFVIPSGVTKIYVTGSGGGGGGARVYGYDMSKAATGGKAGGKCMRAAVTVTPGATYSWTVGAAGAGAYHATSKNGSSGGATTLSGTGVSISLGGGGGGTYITYNSFTQASYGYGGSVSGISGDGALRGSGNFYSDWRTGSGSGCATSGAPGLFSSGIGPIRIANSNSFGDQGYGFGAGGRGCSTDQYNNNSYKGGPGRSGMLLIEA